MDRTSAAGFRFELVCPERLLVGKEITMVLVPGEEGDFGVLAGHAPMISSLRPGVLEIYEKNDTEISDRIFVAGGFTEVTNERCTVLAEEAVPIAELDVGALEQETNNLSEDIGLAKNEAERAGIEARLYLMKAKLEAARGKH